MKYLLQLSLSLLVFCVFQNEDLGDPVPREKSPTEESKEMRSTIPLAVKDLSSPNTRNTSTRMATGALRIHTTPGDAVIYVDDKAVGLSSENSAMLVRLSPGSHRIRMSAIGYQDLEGDVVVKKNLTLPVQGILRPHWDVYRGLEVSARLHVGQRRRLSLSQDDGHAGTDYYFLQEKPGEEFRLDWGAIRHSISIRVLDGEDVVFASTPKMRRGVVSLVMPKSGRLDIEVSSHDKTDAPLLGLIRFQLALFRKPEVHQ